MGLRLYVSRDGVLNDKEQKVLPRKSSCIDDCQDSSLETGVLPSFSGKKPMNTIESESSISNEEISPPASNHFKNSHHHHHPQPTNNSGVPPNTTPLRPPRRIAAVRRNSSSANGSSKINTLDNFNIKDSPTKGSQVVKQLLLHRSRSANLPGLMGQILSHSSFFFLLMDLILLFGQCLMTYYFLSARFNRTPVYIKHMLTCSIIYIL